jgi:RNA polymerase sigma factor (sigma-70 family)
MTIDRWLGARDLRSFCGWQTFRQRSEPRWTYEVMRSDGERRPVGREGAEGRFERLYAEHGRSVLAYAVRRASDGQDAADVVADTFLVAWRRLDDVPPGEAARLWLYGVARNILANQQRSERRRQRLGERLRQELPVVLEGVGAPAQTGAVSAALARLGPDDQEILRLAGWEELSPGEIAVVLGIGQVAVRSRLHRARRRLRAALEPEDKNCVRLQEAQ